MSTPKLPKLRIVKGFFPTAVVIDGQSIDVRITRMMLEQYGVFTKGFQRTQDPHSARMVMMRFPGEEQEKKTVGRSPTAEEEARAARLALYKDLIDRVAPRVDFAASVAGSDDVILQTMYDDLAALVSLPKQEEVFVIDDVEIRRRRLVEMTPEQLAQYERQRDEDEAFAREFVEQSISDCVTALPGQIAEEDGDTSTDITAGADLVRIFGARQDVLFVLLRAISRENTVSQSVKNALRSGVVSQRSSAAPDQAVPGLRPEPAATNAVNGRSVMTEDATALTAGASSGSMANSS